MALVDTLKYIKLDELNSDEKRQLQKVLVGHRRALRAQIRNIDKELAALARKPRARGARRARKGR
jgi:hypothetical protein